MSCNGCRVLRKGCSDTCILRPCLQWIDSPDAQGHATVFVAKFFGRAGLMDFISAVPEPQRPALFQSLLYEACGRTVNPVFGSVGLLWSGNWQTCQAAVDTVLRGSSLQAPAPSSLLNASCFSSFTTPGLAPFPVHEISKQFEAQAAAPAAAAAAKPQQAEPNSDHLLQKRRSFQVSTSGFEDHPSSYSRFPDFPARLVGLPPQVHALNDMGSWKTQMPINMMCSNSAQHRETKVEDHDAPSYGALILAQCAPRRVKSKKTSPKRPQVQTAGAGATIDAEQLELDLTLKVKSNTARGANLQVWQQQHSPCRPDFKKNSSSPCESVSSEGSVTSLESLPNCSLCANWSLDTSSMECKPQYKLLPLLP